MTSNTATAPARLTRDDTGRLFGQTMGLVALTAALFALGAYLGRELSGGWAICFFVFSFAVLLAMNVAVKRSEQLAVALLFAFGTLLGLAVSPAVAYYIETDPRAIAYDFQRLRRIEDIRTAPLRLLDLPRHPLAEVSSEGRGHASSPLSPSTDQGRAPAHYASTKTMTTNATTPKTSKRAHRRRVRSLRGSYRSGPPRRVSLTKAPTAARPRRRTTSPTSRPARRSARSGDPP